MIPILVPTLAELRIELERFKAAERAASDAVPQGTDSSHPAVIAYQAAVDATTLVIDQINAMPVSSLSDLRTKAAALDWWHQTVEQPSYDFPIGSSIVLALVAGLLDERIA